MRKFLMIALVITLTLAMSMSVMADAPQKIKSLHPQLARQLSAIELDGAVLYPEDLTALEVTPGAELRIYLAGADGDGQLFYDQNDQPISTADISISRLRGGQIGVEVIEGDSDMADISFGYAKTQLLSTAAPYISIRFADRASSVEDIAFEFTLCLTQAGEPQDGADIAIAGAMSTAQLEVNTDDIAIDIQDGTVAVATADIHSINVYLGDGVTVTTSMAEGEKYYGVARLELDEPEPREGNSEAAVRKVYTLDTINLDRPGSGVRIESDITLHVYGEDGEYLGTTRDLLPFSSTFYLTNKKIDQFMM